MSKFFKKALAAVLVLALIAVLLPATAITAKAADGDVSSEGYVLFEETFDKNPDGTLVSGKTYSKGTISDGYMTFTNGTNSTTSGREYTDITISGFDIPNVQGDRSYVAVKMEIFISEATNRKAWLSVQSMTTASGTYTASDFTQLDGTSSITPTETASGMFYLKTGKGNITSMKVRVGVREPSDTTSNYVKIDGYRISLVLGENSGKEAASQDMGRYLIAGTGYFQLQRDMTFSSYTDASTSASVYDLIMGSNAVLDLNGYNLTIADGSSLKAPSNAKIVDTSEGKTGKIVCAEDALTIANTAHPTLPIRTADGYVFAEPKLIADTHMMVVEGSQDHDKFTLHFRPGFGTLGNVNVREAYLAGGNSGITMSAYITSVDIYGNRYNLQYNGSEEIVLDGMFDDMYASAEARGQMMFEGFEKYQSLEVTIKLSSGGASCTLPTYTVDNTYVTKHYASEFNYGETSYNISAATTAVNTDGKLDCMGSCGFILDENITTGAGTLVMDFDVNLAEGKQFGFDSRGNSNRWYVIATNGYSTSYPQIVNLNPFSAGEHHVRMELDLNTFAATYYIDGRNIGTYSPAADKLDGFKLAWNNLAQVTQDMSGTTPGACLLDNLMIYTIKTA